MEDNQLVLLEGESKPMPTFPPGLYTGKLRPLHSANEVLVAVVNKLMPDIMRWGQFDDADSEGVARQLLKAIHWGDRDGYSMAKSLERDGSWDPDAELVELLDGADYYGCHRDAIRAWIQDNSVVPAFEVGRQVTVKLRGEGDQVGTIRSLTDDGMYCVMIPAKGHVESGVGTHGTLFTWENVETWNIQGGNQ